MPRNLRFVFLNSLGGKVMSILAFALLASMFIFALSVFYFVNRTESEAWRGRQSEAARNAAGTMSNFIQRVEDSLIILGIVEPDHHAEDSGELRSLLDQNPALLEVVRTDATGVVIAKASRNSSVLANLITIPQSQWFLQARAGQTYIGNVQLSASNEPYLIMAVPSSEDGVVAARVKMDVLWEVVQNIHFGESGQAYVITRNGQIIAHTKPDVVISNTSIQERIEFAAITAAPDNEWSDTFTNFEGRRVVGNTRHIEGTEWVVVAELPVTEAFSSTRNAIFVLGSIAVLLMILTSLVVAQYVRSLIVNPMEQLRKGADTFGEGNLNYRIGLNRKDEIGQLANAFDTMAGHLQDREIQLAEQTKETFASEARYRAIVEDQTELICRFLPDGTLTFVNEAYCRYFNKQRGELIGCSFMPLLPDEDRAQVEAQFASLSPSNPVITYEHRVIMPDGKIRWQQWTDRAIFDEDGRAVEYASVGRDVTDRRTAQTALQASEKNLRQLNAELEERVRKRTSELVAEINERRRMESALRESEERYALAMRGANDGLWDWDLRTNEIYFSPRWKSMLGYQEDEIQNKPEEWFKRIHSEDFIQFQDALNAHLKNETLHFETEYRISDAHGRQHWMLCRGLAVRDDDGKAYRMAGSQTDITDRKHAEERLAHDALHDALTGLTNRTLFVDRLEQRLEHSKRHKDALFAVLFLDLDRFKVINDSLGHTVGDRFLVTTAQRLLSCLRPEDTVSRFGGDEFAVLLSEITDVSDAIRVADRIQARMRGTTMLGPVSRSSSASIGITIFNGNYTDPQEMLRDADSAMYRAKAQGGGRYQLFDVDMYKSALALLQLETDLKRAVEHKEWQIHYQPIISMPGRGIAGVEALIRWKHPQRGIVPPMEFIGVAEDSGLILQIGEYVLRESCRQVKIWRESGFPNLWVSVNISGRQFQDKNLLKIIENILRETGVPGDALRLELTETVAMKDIEYSVRILRELDKLGIHLSLDDFGNGYSSLGYLKRFPLKVLKIDRSFIQDIEFNKNSEAITSAIISMGHTLNLEVVAEGVETEEQLAFLNARLCNEVQGFLFSRPVPAEELSGLLKRKPSF
jgi:diguanylate cyclase (GGDEF)-like protein/PAS domain S-box-containing protein